VNVGVEAAGGENLAFAGDHFGAGADDDADIGLNIGIAGFTGPGDAAALQGGVGLHDSPMGEAHRIGGHGIDPGLVIGDLAVAHAVADRLAAAEFHLLAVGTKILLHLDDDVGIGEPHAVAGGGAEHFGVRAALHLGGHAA